MRAFAVLAALLLLPLAAAHGASVQVAKDEGPYHVIFNSFDFIQVGETVRVAWNVTDRATGQRVHLNQSEVYVAYKAANGTLVGRATVGLQQPVDGIVFGDVEMRTFGATNYTLPLPQGNVTFEQQVCRYDDAGVLHCPGDEAKKSPLPLGLAAAALVLAAVALRRTRRG